MSIEDKINIITPDAKQTEYLKELMGGKGPPAQKENLGSEMVYGNMENPPPPPEPQQNQTQESQQQEQEVIQRLPFNSKDGKPETLMLTDDQYHDLAQKGRNNDKVISRQELEIRTLKEQNQQLFQDNESMQGDAQTGRGIRDLQQNHPELYSKADAVIKSGLQQPNQPTTTELEADIKNLRNTFKTDPKLAEVDTHVLENVLDLVSRGIQAPQAALQTLRDEIAQNNTKVQKYEQHMLTQQQVNQQREGQELQNRLHTEAKKHGVTLDSNDPKMQAIYAYMGNLQYSVEEAFRLAYNLPDEPVQNGNQPEIQTTQTEQIPMAMQPRAGTNKGNSNYARTSKVGISKEQEKVSQWMYGNRMAPRR